MFAPKTYWRAILPGPHLDSGVGLRRNTGYLFSADQQILVKVGSAWVSTPGNGSVFIHFERVNEVILD